MDKLKELYKKYRGVILYLFFGVCSTAVNIAIYYVCAHPLGMETTPATAVAWVVSVAFAYVTNKLFVFESKTETLQALLKEIFSFITARVATGVMDLGIMFLFVDKLHCNDMVVKIASNVLVVILNYVFSKLFIFKKKEQAET